MEEIFEAFDFVLGEEFVDQMIHNLIVIAVVFGTILALVITVILWQFIAKNIVKKHILMISEFQDSEHCNICSTRLMKMSGFGCFLAKVGNGYAGVTKSEVRTIFNTTIVTSNSLSDDEKLKLRNALIRVGCSGLYNMINKNIDNQNE